MSVLTLQKRKGGYFNRLSLYGDEAPDNPEEPLTLYPSSLMTVANISRLDVCCAYVDSLTNFRLQEVVYSVQQMLGPELLAELRKGITSPLTKHLTSTELMFGTENPFARDMIPLNSRPWSMCTSTGFISLALGRDCILHKLFVSALYNLAYLLRFMHNLSAAWLFSVLLARIHDVPDSCLDNAKAAATGVLYTAIRDNVTYFYNTIDKPRVFPPNDTNLLSTYYQLTQYIRKWSFTRCPRNPYLMYFLLADDTVKYIPEDLPENVLESDTFGPTQTRTQLLPGTCYEHRLGTTGFSVPALHAISDHKTHVMLFPATKECYKFLCAVYGLKPYDGITPLPNYEAMFWESLFHPQMFIQIAKITNPSAEYEQGKPIFNKAASLTDYIPDLPSSDSPQYRVNEFEVPVRL